MRKIFVILFLIVSAVANSQEQFKPVWQKVNKTNTLKINLLSPIRNAITVAYEREFGKEASWQVTASYMNDGYYETYLTENIKSAHITPEIRQVLLGNERDNIYVGAFARYIFAEYEYQYTEGAGYYVGSYLRNIQQYGSYHSAGLGILGGKKYTFKEKFVFDLFAGVAYTRIVNAYSREIITNYVNGSGTPFLVIDDNSTRNTNTFYGNSLVPRAYMNGYGIRAGIMLGYKF